MYSCSRTSRCGGTRTILVDTGYGNRAERRKAKHNKEPMQKYIPCPECSPDRSG